jgi:Na+/melibiose symporter-like transporter
MLGYNFLKKRFDSRAIFITATVANILGYILLFTFGRANANNEYTLLPILIISFFMMLPIGVLNIVPTVMISDTVDYMEYKTGKRNEGVAFSLFSMRNKLANGLSAFTLLLLLSYFNFVQPVQEGGVPVEQDQTPETLAGIFMIYSLIPAFGMALSLIPILFYNLHGKKLKDMREELRKRHEESQIKDEVIIPS